MKFEALLDSKFGARVSSVNLKKITNEQIITICKNLYDFGFLIFEEQELSEVDYIDFGKKLGELRIFLDESYRHPEFPEIFVVSNVKRENKKFGMDRAGLYWHTDGCFLKEPQPLTMLYCQIAPLSGGETAFIDTRETYRLLPKNIQNSLKKMQVEQAGQLRYIIVDSDVGLSIQELLDRDLKVVPPVCHPAIFHHPKTDRICLYVNPGFTSKIVDEDKKQHNELLTLLFECIEKSVAQYVHTWKKNEIVIWDNRSVLHRAFPSNENSSRLMFRLGISDGSFFGDKQ